MRKITGAIIVAGALVAGCATPAPGPTATATQGTVAPAAATVPRTEVPTAAASHTATPALAPSPMPSPTATEVPPAPSPTMSAPTPSPSPTPTSVPQTLGRIFPEGYDSPGVWSNTNTGLDIVAMGFNIHFDVGLPLNLVTGQDAILSPASGRITKVYTVPRDPREGQVVEIEPDPPLAGVDTMISSAGLDPLQVQAILFYLAHVIPLRTEGWVGAGEPVGMAFDAWFDPDVVGYVIVVRLRDGREFNFSPCSLPNTAEFCGKCYPGTPYNCP